MRSLQNLTGSHLEPGRDSCAHGSSRRAWVDQKSRGSLFASPAFVTVTLAANMRGGMWTQIVYEGKSDRTHPYGPTFPCQLVSHSPTHWITQEALSNTIDAIDADMHALVTPNSHPGCCSSAVRHSTLLRNFAASCSTPGRTSNCATSSGNSRDGPGVHARLQELDPPGGSRTLRRVLRVQLRACQSRLQYRCAPTAAALIRAHSRTERRQPATSNRWLALHRLERGGAA